MITLPWRINLATPGNLNAGSTATITASISLPDGMSLASGSMNITLGDIKAGSTAKATWKVKVDRSVSGKSVVVKAQGVVSGHVPEAHWTGQSVTHPPYDYMDAIGGMGSLML